MSLGKIESGGNLNVNVQRLIETRLLIEANSGGGKSYLIRKLLEETHGKVQQIVFDMEGEFSTLREKFDYILIGKDGDIPADPRSAELLARKLLELNVSAIIDLYELKHADRIRFIKLFLDSAINSPKELWHSVLFVVDEAHIFCPEKGESEAMGAVIDLATRGRKRGFGSVLATQRLSKLHKDAAAEMINKLIGRTSLDIDMKRAADELGFTSKEQMLSLRRLQPGEFYAFGPALSNDIVKVKIGEVKTTHPRAGERAIAFVPVATDKVLKVLSKLADLPKEAEKELKTKEDMQKKIRELQFKLRQLPKPEIDQGSVDRAYARGASDMQRNFTKIKDEMKMQNQRMISKLKKIGELSVMLGAAAQIDNVKINFENGNKIIKVPTRDPIVTVPVRYFNKKDEFAPPQESTENATYVRCEKMILKFLMLWPDRTFTRVQVGALTGYSTKSGSFKNSISRMRGEELIKVSGDNISINQDYIDRASQIAQDIQLNSLSDWIGQLELNERKIFQLLLDSPDDWFTRDDISGQTGYSKTSGSFKNAISHLNTLGLIQRESDRIKFNEQIREFL